MKTASEAERAGAIRELEQRKTVFERREAQQPGLWTEYVRDCEISLARLRAGLELTRLQRGLPSL